MTGILAPTNQYQRICIEQNLSRWFSGWPGTRQELPDHLPSLQTSTDAIPKASRRGFNCAGAMVLGMGGMVPGDGTGVGPFLKVWRAWDSDCSGYLFLRKFHPEAHEVHSTRSAGAASSQPAMRRISSR